MALRFVGRVLFALALAGCEPDQADTPPVELGVPFERFELENGLEVAVAPNHLVPEITALVAVHAGAFTEDDSTNGYAHLFEHMIFDGSEDIPDPVVFRNELDALGASSNATTGVDVVTYFFTVETGEFDPALGLFADALRRPALTDEQLAREKQVVLGEFDLNEADYDFIRGQRVLEELFGETVSRVSPLGSRDAVLGATADDLRRAHDKYYVPNNSLLVLAGDVSTAEARSFANAKFGDWERASDPFASDSPPATKALKKSSYIVLEAPIADTRVTIGWPCPTANDDPRAVAAGSLLSQITNQSDHSFREIVGSDAAHSASFSFIPHRYASYVSVDIRLDQGREDVLRIAGRNLARIASPGDVTAAQLGIAKDALFGVYLYTSDDPDRLGHRLASDWGLEGLGAYETYVESIYGVGLGDLDRIAGECVRNRPHVVVLQTSADNMVGLDAAYLESLL